MDELKQALNGWLYVVFNLPRPMQDFESKVKLYNKQRFNFTANEIHKYTPQLYDSVLLFAHGATRVLAEGGDVSSLLDGKAVVRAMTNSTFRGVQGDWIELNDDGDTIAQYYSVCTHACTMSTHAHTYAHMHVCTHTRTHIHARMLARTHIHACTHKVDQLHRAWRHNG